MFSRPRGLYYFFFTVHSLCVHFRVKKPSYFKQFIVCFIPREKGKTIHPVAIPGAIYIMLLSVSYSKSIKIL